MQYSSSFRQGSKLQAGFTLLEILVVLVIVGVLVAIATPSWMRFWANRQVTTARDELRLGIQQAQASAIAQRSSWRFSLREKDGLVEWAIHPNAVDWTDVSHWQALHPNIKLHQPDTTLAKKEDVYYVRFGFKGDVEHRLSTVTLEDQNGHAQTKCVVISTLLGATRQGQEHLYPNGNKRYCY